MIIDIWDAPPVSVYRTIMREAASVASGRSSPRVSDRERES